tara:strand:- start:226 stop:573 length:348 start_codon:yes stop_codon:yes gene_type:complete
MVILDNVVKLHDELMLEMKDIKSLKVELIEMGFESNDTLVADLDKARSSMMKFMKKFSDEFQFDKYPMNKKKSDSLSVSSLKLINDQLVDQKKSIDKVSILFTNSINNAKKALNN